MMKNLIVVSLMALIPLSGMAESYSAVPAENNSVPQNGGYNNPIIPGYHPDPSVCRVGDKFYLVNSSFQYFPGVPIFESTDMKSWKQIGNVLDRESQLPLKGASSWLGIYAPTIRYNDGTYYMITTNVGNGGNFMVTAKDPKGPWSEPIWLKQQGIDPSLYFENGKCYMVSNPDNMITLCEINPTTGEQLTESKGIWQGDGGRYPEGPHIYKKDGYYYLLISEGGTELAHHLTIARSRSIYGPYESNPANPIFTHCSMAGQSNQIQGTGHGDFVQARDGQWWIAFLAYRNFSGSYHHLGRETFLAPVEWKEGEWPVVNDGKPIDVNAKIPSTIYLNTGSNGFCNMGPEWIYLQNPAAKKYELRGSVMRLHCSESSLSANNTPTFLGRRQESAAMEVLVKIDGKNLKQGDEAGVTLYQINNGHFDIALKRIADGKLAVIARYVVKSLTKEEQIAVLTGDTGSLGISSDGSNYVMSVVDGSNGKVTKTAPQECSLLSTEVVGGFTGLVIGMYATGEGSADFHSFNYVEK